MKKLRLIKNILVRTRAHKILFTYILFVLLSALIILLAEPNIHTYRNALWYCYAVISTTGFGDITIVTPVAKLLSLLLTVYSLFVIAIVTGVIVNYYNQIIQIRQKETLSAFIDKLERLPELSPEELKDLSEKAFRFQQNFHKHSAAQTTDLTSVPGTDELIKAAVSDAAGTPDKSLLFKHSKK